MSAVTASPYWTLLFVVFVSADPKIITAESGQDVTLTCGAPNNNIIVVEWKRADLGDKYVFLYQDHPDPENQHPSFKNRVDLQDRQMKDGDVSLILKNVTTHDAGTYVCGVFVEGEQSWELISIIYLRVDPPGHTGGDTEDGGKEDGGNGGLPKWLIIFLGIVLLVVLIYNQMQQWKIKHRKQFGRSAGFSKLKSKSPSAIPGSPSYPTRRKTDAQGQKESDDDDLHCQSPV